MPAFLSQDWCGLAWTVWIPLDKERDALKEIPDVGGVYRVRAKDREQLLYIGQTGRSLRNRISTLAKYTFLDENQMPFNDPHTAAQNLWVWRKVDKDMAFECSASPTSLTEDMRRGLEHMLLWRYHFEKGESPLCTHGRFHQNYFRSGSKKSGKRGGQLPLGQINPSGNPSSRPLALTGNPCDRDWMGLSWSDPKALSEEELAAVPSSSGLYKILDASVRQLYYVGETRNLHYRIDQHRRDAYANLNPLFSFHELGPDILDHQRRELETDLLGAYYETVGRPPSFQYGKS